MDTNAAIDHAEERLRGLAITPGAEWATLIACCTLAREFPKAWRVIVVRILADVEDPLSGLEILLRKAADDGDE